MNRIAFLSMNRLTEIFNILHNKRYITDIARNDDNLDQQYHNSYKNENVEKEMNLFNNSSRNRIYF